MKDVIQENKALLREMKDRVEILEDTKEKIQSLPNPESIVPKVELIKYKILEGIICLP